ncbi:MAG TPA: helix-turn-helix transcriptional regulator [Pseudonocardiaceae bacterium]|jgi:transcriptional regulator with XRE-family HTH domain|nr:helix-turn-helix transcriptional regulator [Pseudonocardiaceae bacterium]
MAATGHNNDDRDELSRALHAARTTAGLGQIEAARRARTSQNKISRVENGKGLLTIAEAEALLTVYGVHGDERRRIMTLVEAARAGHIDSRVILQRGAHHFQERIRQLDEQSRLVRSFAPTAVLGILQTRAYAQVVFTQRMTEDQAAPSIASRMARHRMLDDPNRRWVLLQTEGALRWNLGGPAVMVEQIERIATALDQPNVRLGIIPWQTPTRVLPLHGFHLYDHRAVVVGTRSGTAILDEREVPDYETLFGELEYLAVFGADARTLLHRIADDYRNLQVPSNPSRGNEPQPG